MATIHITGNLIYGAGTVSIHLDDEQLIGGLNDAVANGDISQDDYYKIANILEKGITLSHEMYCDHGPSVYDSYCPKCSA
jgi:hypothetical protein